MELLMGSLAIAIVLIALVAVRISRTASWQSVATIAVATGSLKTCVAFIHFCLSERT